MLLCNWVGRRKVFTSYTKSCSVIVKQNYRENQLPEDYGFKSQTEAVMRIAQPNGVSGA